MAPRLRPQNTTPEPVVEPPAVVAAAAPAPSPVIPTRDDHLIAAFRALGFALSARALLLLTLVGAFVLACGAMWSPSAVRIGVLALYSVMTVIPVTILEIRKRAQ